MAYAPRVVGLGGIAWMSGGIHRRMDGQMYRGYWNVSSRFIYWYVKYYGAYYLHDRFVNLERYTFA